MKRKSKKPATKPKKEDGYLLSVDGKPLFRVGGVTLIIEDND